MADQKLTACRHCGGEHDTSIDRAYYCEQEREYQQRQRSAVEPQATRTNPALVEVETGKRTRTRRPTSRRGRWEEAAVAARTAYDALQGPLDELNAALEVVRGIQQEYSDWKDALPESLQNGELGQKLDEIGNIEIADDLGSTSLDDVGEQIAAIEGADLPSGRNG